MGRVGEGFDVAVVGGGAAGCVVAARLAESGNRSVVLLEAGPDARGETPEAWRDGWRLPTLPDWGFQSEPSAAGQTNKLRRGRLLGGTSWLTRFAVRGAAADFDAWAAVGNPGWAFADVLPAFRRLEADAEFGADAHHGDAGPIPITRYPSLEPSAIHAAGIAALAGAGIRWVADLNAPDAVGLGRVPMSSRDGARVTALDGYLDARPTSSSLTIRPESEVAFVVVEAGRATGVRLVEGSEIRAGWVVVAAGAYGSPTLLQRSGIGPAEHLRGLGIPVLVDLPGVGANLADHPAVEFDTGWRGGAVGGAVLNTIATFRSQARPKELSPDLLFWVSDPAGDEPGFWIDSVLLKPASRGTVRLRSSDPADPPRITLPGLRDPVDVDRLVEATGWAAELANRPEIRGLSTGAAAIDPPTPAARRQRVVDEAYSIPHVVGTCAMGPDPANGAVVDARCAVHGVERLSVIDASVMPDAPSGFPHLVTIMIGEHAAEMLAARL